MPEESDAGANISSTNETSPAPFHRPPETVGEQHNGDSADENTEMSQLAKEEEGLMQQNVAASAPGPTLSLYDRFGWLAITVLIFATTLILSALGFLWFLWKADYNNKTWHRIAAKSWITRTVALSSLVMRTSMSMQASTATSMLAGLALENTQILLLHFASVSTMRSANAGPYILAWLILKAFLKDPSRWHRALVPTLILILVITSTLAQFTSTTLLADLKPGIVPGDNSSHTMATNFHTVNGSTPFTLRGTVWDKKPPFYPTFAEYHEAPSLVEEDKSDTGLTLRAFLPLSGQEARSSLRAFSGLATVLDCRVQCFRPELTLEAGHYTTGALALTGSISAAGSQSTNFSCVLPQPVSDAEGNTVVDEWQIAMTYLGMFPNASSAPVHSELRPLTSRGQYGMGFVVVNLTAGSLVEWQTVLGIDGGEFGTFGTSGVGPVLYSSRQEWLDLLFTKNASLIMSVSLCYSSYDTADLAIQAFSDSNRTEPVPRYDPLKQNYDYSGIRSQLGQLPHGQQAQILDERGVLSLSKRDSWNPGVGDDANSSWLIDAVALTLADDLFDSQTFEIATSTGNNITAHLYAANNYSVSVWPGEPRLGTDASTTALFQQIVKDQRGIASAIQSLLTVFTSMSYYDQLQQFNSANNISMTSFMVVSKPASVRGLTAVTIVASVHLLLIAYIVYRFLAKSSVSTVGNAWQTVAQVMQGDAKVLVDGAGLATDSRVEEEVKMQRWKRRLVGVRRSPNGIDVELTHNDSPGGLAKMMRDATHKRHNLRRCRANART